MRILLVDDQPIFRDPVAMGLESLGYQVAAADSATQALDLLARFLPQLVVVDLSMPAINGLDFIKYLRSRGHYRLLPVIMLTAHSDQRFIIEAAKLGVRDYLLKSSFSLLDLHQRIQNHATAISGHAAPSSVPISSCGTEGPGNSNAAPAPIELPKISMKELLEGVSLMAMKPQAAKMMAICSSPDASLADLENELKQDPVLAAKILQIANTTAFRRGSPVNKLGEAISLMGLTNLRNAVSSVVIEGEFLSDLVEADAWRAWQNALAMARVLGEVDDPKIGPFPGSGYILGLCANLAPMLVTGFMGDRYTAIRDHCESQKISPIKALETIFGHSIEEIYAEVLAKIGLPSQISAVLKEYSRLNSGESFESMSRTVRVMDAANHWCRAMGYAMLPFMPLRAIAKEEMKETPSLGKVPFRLGDIRTEVMALSYEFTRESKALRKILEKPYFTLRSDIRVALHCDPWVAADGPIHQFLGTICDSQLVELDEFDDPKWTGLVIVSDSPLGKFPMGVPSKAPLLVLHRVPLAKKDLPAGERVGALRLPCSMADIARAVQSF
jgi:CheY-like chemotaxis protein/HD-like signal output (HDOD) protein